NTALEVSGKVDVPLAEQATFSGSVTAAGQYNLMGKAAISVAGFQLDAALTLANSGLAVNSRANVPFVGWVGFSGSVTSQGQYSLTGTAAFALVGFQLDVSMTL